MGVPCNKLGSALPTSGQAGLRGLKKPAKGGGPAPQAAAEQGTTSPAKRKRETGTEIKERGWHPGSTHPDVYTRSAHWSPPRPTGTPRIKKNMLGCPFQHLFKKKKKFSDFI